MKGFRDLSIWVQGSKSGIARGNWAFNNIELGAEQLSNYEVVLKRTFITIQ